MAGSSRRASAESSTLHLSYRPPFDWAGLLGFLRARELKGVERVEEGRYLRTAQLGGHTGWIHVRHAPKQHALLGRLRHVFDLSARTDVIEEDRLLLQAVSRLTLLAPRRLHAVRPQSRVASFLVK